MDSQLWASVDLVVADLHIKETSQGLLFNRFHLINHFVETALGQILTLNLLNINFCWMSLSVLKQLLYHKGLSAGKRTYFVKILTWSAVSNTTSLELVGTMS